MKKRILLEASGSLIANWMIRAVREAGHLSIASDIVDACVGGYLADAFVRVPRSTDGGLWEEMERILVENAVDIVIPSLDETLMLWAGKRETLRENHGIRVVVSEPRTIATFVDKLETYRFFRAHGIPTPETSVEPAHRLLKPRYGRGGKGIRRIEPPYEGDMTGMISQELLEGQEYTVDCLVDHGGEPVYIVPRKRLHVKEGKSVAGITAEHQEIVRHVQRILASARFFGPINLQCFDTADGVRFTEVNARIAGGMALGLAATENWVPLMVDHLLEGRPVPGRRPVRHGLRMYRYYEEVFVQPDL